MVQSLGHDYYGRSSTPNSLMIWTHSMRDIEFHDNFIPAGSPNNNETFKAVTLSAGLTWMDVYAAASVDRNLVSWIQYLTEIQIMFKGPLDIYVNSDLVKICRNPDLSPIS